jgi:hypothetical protein
MNEKMSTKVKVMNRTFNEEIYVISFCFTFEKHDETQEDECGRKFPLFYTTSSDHYYHVR